MPPCVTLAGRTFAVLFPPRFRDTLFPFFKPFPVFESDCSDASFSTAITDGALSLEGTALRGDIYFREYDPASFSIGDSRFMLHVSLSDRSSRLSLRPLSDEQEMRAIIFSAFKWFMTYIIIYEGGLPMHSSLVEHRGNGLLFCGPSGRGKSTICTLLAEHLRGSHRGSDELNVVISDAAVLNGYPTPYFSSGGSGNLSDNVPLKNIFFLEQAPINRVESIDERRIFERLLKNVFHISGNKLLTDTMMNTIAHISAAGIHHVLYFKNDCSIARFLESM